MHNKHQELILEKVTELIEKVRALNGVSALKIEKRFEYQQGYQDATTMFYIHLTGTPKTKGMMQDTIDTVLEEEGDGRNDCLHTNIKHLFNGYGGILGFTENDLHNLVNTPLDKTPPNKV